MKQTNFDSSLFRPSFVCCLHPLAFCFPFKKYVIVIEVADSAIGICQFQTTVCPLGPSSNEREVIKTAVAMHNNDPDQEQEAIVMRKAKDGSMRSLTVPIEVEAPGNAVIDITTDRVGMTWEIPINKSLKYDVMAASLDEFLSTTVELNSKFKIAKNTPATMLAHATHEVQKSIFPAGLLKCA